MPESFKLPSASSKRVTLDVSAEQAPYLDAYHQSRAPTMSLEDFIIRELLVAAMQQRKRDLVDADRIVADANHSDYEVTVSSDGTTEIDSLVPKIPPPEG